MGDTQKSQTISTESQGIATQVAHDSTGCSQERAADKPPVLVGESSLVRIRMLAEANPSLVFTSLAHRIDLSLLRKSFRQLRKNESTGVDKITAKQYTVKLDENLYKIMGSGHVKQLTLRIKCLKNVSETVLIDWFSSKTALLTEFDWGK